MYHAIVARAQEPAPVLRAVIGVPVLLLAALIMLPWLVLNAAVSATVLMGRGLIHGPRALVQAVDYAGRVALGR